MPSLSSSEIAYICVYVCVCDSVHFENGVELTWGELKIVLVLVLVLGQDIDLKEMKKFMTNSGGCLVLLLLLLGWRQADRQAGRQHPAILV
jgi:hypothetical protein